MKTVYIFSGLGADHRAFQGMDFSGFETVFIQWITPEKNENMQSYAQRLSVQVKTENPVLIGLSFGGMIASEVAALIPVEKLILIASAKTKWELPLYYRIAGKLRLHKLIPADVLKKSGKIANWFFGTESEAEQHLLKAILDDTDRRFLKWAINAIVHWKRERAIDATHIHGTSDRIIPFRNIQSAIPIYGGGHFMTVNKTVEISTILQRLV